MAHQTWRLARQRVRAAQHTAAAAAEAVAAVEAATASPPAARHQQGQQPAPASPRVLQRTSAVLRVPSLVKEEDAAGEAATCAAPWPGRGAAPASGRTIRGSQSAVGGFRHVLFAAHASSDSPFLMSSASGHRAVPGLQGKGERKGGLEAGLAISASGSTRVLPPLPGAGSSSAWSSLAPSTPHHEC